MRKFFLFTALALGATQATYAFGPDAYVGAGVTQARIDDIFESGHGLDLDNTAWKVFAGIRPIAPFAVEADYMSLGHQSAYYFDGTSAHADAHAVAAYAVGFLPLPVPLVDVFGKAGAARWDLSGHTYPSFFSLDDHGTDFAWGVGAQAHFGALGLRVEYEQFDVRDTNGVKAVSFDASFHFL